MIPIELSQLHELDVLSLRKLFVLCTIESLFDVLKMLIFKLIL